MTKTEDAVAAFLARGGKVRKVDPDASAGLTARDWADTVRGKVTDANAHIVPEDTNKLIEERHVRGDVVYNGLGEIIGRL